MVASSIRPQGLRALFTASLLGGVCLPFAGLALAGTSTAPALNPDAASAPSLASPLAPASPARGLRVATLDLPRPLGTGAPSIETFSIPQGERNVAPLPAPSVFLVSRPAEGEAPATRSSALMDLAFDVALELPVLTLDGASLAATYSALAERLGGSFPHVAPLFGGEELGGLTPADVQALLPEEEGPTLPATLAPQPDPLAGEDSLPPEMQEAALPATQADDTPARPANTALHHDPVAIFGTDPKLFPPLAFEYDALAGQGLVPRPLTRPEDKPALTPASTTQADMPEGIWPSPAQRLGLKGKPLAKAQKCLAEAVYFESRGEPKRGQVAVAQVVMNRVFSGYYPADVCGTVYQNAHRHLSCQFTFACDDVKDVVREPDMWKQANAIAADMLDGRLWLESVSRATHYHAHWVNPGWVREMRKLDRIGVHTFYRPLNWKS